jgi:transposase
MIVLGADTHKRSHTIAAVAAATGELLGEQPVQVGGRGFDALLRWGRALDDELVWALEDCRHVSGSLERFLIERGERVLGIATQLTARERKRSPTGQGPTRSTSPAPCCRKAWTRSPPRISTGPNSTCGYWSIIANASSATELSSTARCSGISGLWPQLQLPGGALFSKKCSTRIAGRLARAEQTMRVRIARDMLRRLRELTQTVNQYEREIPRSSSRSRPNCSPNLASGR